MERISRSKTAELVRSAKLPFSQKLALSAAASRNGKPFVLSESFADPVLEIIKLFNLAVKNETFDRYALAFQLEQRWTQLLAERSQAP